MAANTWTEKSWLKFVSQKAFIQKALLCVLSVQMNFECKIKWLVPPDVQQNHQEVCCIIDPQTVVAAASGKTISDMKQIYL